MAWNCRSKLVRSHWQSMKVVNRTMWLAERWLTVPTIGLHCYDSWRSTSHCLPIAYVFRHTCMYWYTIWFGMYVHVENRKKAWIVFFFYRLHKIVIVFITANWEPVMWFREIKLMVYSSNKSYDAHSHTGLNTHFSLNPSFAVTVPPPITSLLEQYSNLSFESPFSPSFLSSHCIRICVSAHVTHFSFAYEIFYDWLNYELFSYKFR